MTHRLKTMKYETEDSTSKAKQEQFHQNAYAPQKTNTTHHEHENNHRQTTKFMKKKQTPYQENQSRQAHLTEVKFAVTHPHFHLCDKNRCRPLNTSSLLRHHTNKAAQSTPMEKILRETHQIMFALHKKHFAFGQPHATQSADCSNCVTCV